MMVWLKVEHDLVYCLVQLKWLFMQHDGEFNEYKLYFLLKSFLFYYEIISESTHEFIWIQLTQ